MRYNACTHSTQSSISAVFFNSSTILPVQENIYPRKSINPFIIKVAIAISMATCLSLVKTHSLHSSGPPAAITILKIRPSPLLKAKAKLKIISPKHIPTTPSQAKSSHIAKSIPQPISSNQLLIKQVIKQAISLLGVPFIWGGTSPKGFDCSGFIQYVWRKAGVYLPRTTYEQVKIGEAVAKSHLQKGDLVFFQTDAPGPSHVGLYIGNEKFIHADAQKGISIALLNNPYWHAHFLIAINPLKKISA